MPVFAVLDTHIVWRAIGIAIASLMMLGAARRHRVGTASTAFITGIGPWWDGFIIFGAIYIVFGFLLVRTGRQVGRDSGGPRR